MSKSVLSFIKNDQGIITLFNHHFEMYLLYFMQLLRIKSLQNSFATDSNSFPFKNGRPQFLLATEIWKFCCFKIKH